MTIDELIDFCRLQVDETEDSYWTPADWRSYALLAMKKFLVTTKLGLVRERIILDPNIVQPEETQHELQITCVADLPLGGNTINQQSFVLTDLSGQNWTFKYSTSGQVSTQAERDAFLFWVAITALDDAQTVALKTHAIIAASGFPAAAVLLAEFITITFNVAGYTTGYLAGHWSGFDPDVFLARYDAHGSQSWIAQFGTSDLDAATRRQLERGQRATEHGLRGGHGDFGDQRHADHQQETQGQHDHGGVLVDEVRHRVRRQHHHCDRDDHSRDHDRHVVGHADSRDDGVDRKDQVQQQDLEDGGREADGGRPAARLALVPFVARVVAGRS